MLHQVLVDVRPQVGLVGVVALQGVEDREPRPQSEGRGHLAELKVEVDDAHLLLGVVGEEAGQIGGVERLAAAPGRRRRREHGRGLGGFGGEGGGDRGHGRLSRLAELDGPLEAREHGLVARRQLEHVDCAGAHDVAQAGVGPAREREQHAHRRLVVVDHLEPGQARAGAQGGPGDEHVERTVGLHHVADRADARAHVHLRPWPQVVDETPDLVCQGLAPIEDEDLRVPQGPSGLRAGPGTRDPVSGPPAGSSARSRGRSTRTSRGR